MHMKMMTREEAIAGLREALLALTDDEHSLCQVAAEKRIYCHGFKQWSDSELFRHLRWLAERKGITSRAELEAAANRWHLQRQEVLGLPIACDAQRVDHDQCWGWDNFTNRELEQFYREVAQQEIRIGSV
jgi:hypothetical protein